MSMRSASERPGPSEPEAFLEALRLLSRRRRARDRAFRLSRALPVAGVAASVSLTWAAASGLLAPLRATALDVAIACAALTLAASFALALVLGRRDRALRSVAADADRRLGLNDRASAALEVLESGAAREPGSMPALVVRDAIARWPENAPSRLFPRVRLAGPLAWVAAACVLPFMLLPLSREPHEAGAGEALRRTSAPDAAGAEVPPLRFLAIVPDEGPPGTDVSLVIDGELPGSLTLRFGTRDVPVRTVRRGGVSRLVATVPGDLAPGVIPVVLRQGRRRSGSLAFRVVDVPFGLGGDGAGDDPVTADHERSEDEVAEEAGVPTPLAAGDAPPEPQPEPRVAAVPRFVRPLESPEGKKRVREAFVLEDDPENLPATRPLDEASGAPGSPGEARFEKIAEDAVRRPDLSSRDREAVRRYFEVLERSATRGDAGRR